MCIANNEVIFTVYLLLNCVIRSSYSISQHCILKVLSVQDLLSLSVLTDSNLEYARTSSSYERCAKPLQVWAFLILGFCTNVTEWTVVCLYVCVCVCMCVCLCVCACVCVCVCEFTECYIKSCSLPQDSHNRFA